jgi:hypothetical protein
MKEDFFEENWKPLVALALGVGVGALIAKSLMTADSDEDEYFGPKDYACLKLPKEALERYHRNNCKILRLEFDEIGSGKVKLKLKGFGMDGIIARVSIPLHVDKEGCYTSQDSPHGKFKHDDSGTPLHDLIAGDEGNFRDWWLEPVKCDLDPKYVSYNLNDRAAMLVTRRLNPSPPY